MEAKTIRNRHGTARAAMEHWLSHGLWGSPIQLGPDKFHVYGANRRNWTPVSVEFEADEITVCRPKESER